MCAFSSAPRNCAADWSVTRLTHRSTTSMGGKLASLVMRAALIEASNTPLEVVDDIDIEEPRTGEGLVRVSHCGLCHSSVSLQDGKFRGLEPTVLGHEAAGVVEAVGDGVTSVVPGDRVVL